MARDEWLGVVAALLAGFALRALFVAHHPRFAGDTLVYGDLAQNLLRHGVYGLTEDHIRPTLIRLPGYPLFLAACFALFGVGRYLPVLWVQVGVDLLGCVLLADLARRAFGVRVGWATLWLGALCPFTANYAAAALTETLSIFCVTFALWALWIWAERWRAGQGTGRLAVGLGCGLAFAAVLRPDGGLLAAAVVPAMLWAAWRGRRADVPQRLKPRRAGGIYGMAEAMPFLNAGGDKRGFGAEAVPFRSAAWHRKGSGKGLRDAALASGLLCAALGLWAWRNWHVFHVLQPLAPKYANDPGEEAPLGFARWYRTWGTGFGDTNRVYWTYDGSEERLGDLPPWAFDDAEQRERTAALYARYNAVTSSTPAIEAGFAALAAERVRTHPVRYYVLFPLARLGDMWLRPRTELLKMPLDWWRVRAHPWKSMFAMTYAGLNLGLLVLAGLGLRRLGWRDAGVAVHAGVAFAVLRSAMLMTIDNSEPRYTLECFPVVLLLAGVAVVRNSKQGRGNSKQRLGLRGRGLGKADEDSMAADLPMV